MTAVDLSAEDLNRIFQALVTERHRLAARGPARVGRRAIVHASDLAERFRLLTVAAIDAADPHLFEGTDERAEHAPMCTGVHVAGEACSR